MTRRHRLDLGELRTLWGINTAGSADHAGKAYAVGCRQAAQAGLVPNLLAPGMIRRQQQVAAEQLM